MPLLQGRKRRAEREPEEEDDVSATPEPQTQRRRTQHEEEDDDGAFAADNEATQSTGADDLAKKLVRLALASEYQRRPIRRQDISEKVLGSNSRAFKEVFGKAQMHLQSVFGMQMIELPAREKVTLAQRRAAQKKDSQVKTAATWILTSTLPQEFRIPLFTNENEQQQGFLQPPSAPTPELEAQYVGIYTLLVSLISLSGGQLADSKMERYLRKLHLDDQTPLPEQKKNEQLMKRLERDGYIYRIKEASGTGEDDIYWVVGPRGRMEVGDDGVRGLAAAVHGDLPEAEEDELDRKLSRSLGLVEQPAATKKQKQQPNGEQTKKRGRRQDEDNEDDGGEVDDEDEDE